MSVYGNCDVPGHTLLEIICIFRVHITKQSKIFLYRYIIVILYQTGTFGFLEEGGIVLSSVICQYNGG